MIYIYWIFYHYVPHSNRCGAFCFLIKPSIFKASSCLRKKSPPTGGQIKRLPHFEPLPVKRTVKNQKILATSNRNVAGCFLWKADTVSQSLQ